MAHAGPALGGLKNACSIYLGGFCKICRYETIVSGPPPPPPPHAATGISRSRFPIEGNALCTKQVTTPLQQAWNINTPTYSKRIFTAAVARGLFGGMEMCLFFQLLLDRHGRSEAPSSIQDHGTVEVLSKIHNIPVLFIGPFATAPHTHWPVSPPSNHHHDPLLENTHGGRLPVSHDVGLALSDLRVRAREPHHAVGLENEAAVR